MSHGNLGRRSPHTAPSEQATRDDIIWAAGIFEGEGYCYSPGRVSERAEVSQKGTWLVTKLCSLFGGKVDGPVRDNMYNWRVTGARARGFLQSVYGLLSPRRQKQIRKTLAIAEFSEQTVGVPTESETKQFVSQTLADKSICLGV